MLKNLLLFTTLLLFLGGCNSQEKHKQLNGKALLEQKCSSCHNLDLPPKTFEDEVAPPMMAVAFHIVNFTKVNDESQRVSKSIDFVKDYVINPSASKSYCDKKSLESYGVMPSQKGKVTQDELDAIARYIFAHFTQENLMKEQAAMNKLKAMPKGQQLALKNNCLGCHKQTTSTVGPSFEKIRTLYKNDNSIIIKSIQNGSKGKWKEAHGVMPPFKNLTDEELHTISEWILHP